MANTDEDDFDFDFELELEGQDDLDLSVHPHPMGIDTRVRIEKDQFTVFELLRCEERGTLVLDPDFQRSDVWKKKDQSELIESILIGIPIPLIYLFEDENGKRQIVDGKQRITALKKFINDDFALSKLSMLSDLSGKKFSEIAPLLQSKLEDYQLHTYVIQPPTPEYVKFNIFERVNRGGVKLNKQEMRHALYLGKATQLIQELAESQEFILATAFDKKSNRMRDRYLILRFIAFYLWEKGQLTGIKYNSDIDDFLAVVMQFLNTKASDKLLKHVKDISLPAMNNVHEILGIDAFRFQPKNGGKKRPVNMGLFEMLLFSFCSLDVRHMNAENSKRVVEKYKLQIDQEGFFSNSIDTAFHVNKRFEIAKKITNELKNA